MNDAPSSQVLTRPLQSPSPSRTVRPKWLDLRLIGGIVLVLAAVAAGAGVISSADHRHAVWALSQDLAGGAVLTSADLHTVQVQLGSASSRYVAAAVPVVGRAVAHDVVAGQLLPAADLATPEQGITVSVPVRPENAPDVQAGNRISVWLATKACRGVLVLDGAVVQSVRQSAGVSFGAGSALRLDLT